MNGYISAKSFAKNKVTAGLKREFKTEPKGASFRLLIIGGLVFITYSIIQFDGNFSMAYDSIAKPIIGLVGGFYEQLN